MITALIQIHDFTCGWSMMYLAQVLINLIASMLVSGNAELQANSERHFTASWKECNIAGKQLSKIESIKKGGKGLYLLGSPRTTTSEDHREPCDTKHKGPFRFPFPLTTIVEISNDVTSHRTMLQQQCLQIDTMVQIKSSDFISYQIFIALNHCEALFSFGHREYHLAASLK